MSVGSIHGIGVDLVHVPGMRDQLGDRASGFAEGVFTVGERSDAASRASGDPARHLAARFAAKEAFVKAWSGGFFGAPPRLDRVDLRHIEVIADAWGRPALRLAPPLAERVGPLRAHLSLSHDGDHAIAQVVLERPPPSEAPDAPTADAGGPR